MNKLLVAGSINMDIVALTSRHPKVGETVFGTDLNYFPGGKGANQAVAASKLGAETIMIGMVGSDAFGSELIKFLGEQGITNQIGVDPKFPTGTALITVSAETSNNTIVVIPGANFQLGKFEIDKPEINKGDILVSQFEIPIDTIIAFFKKGRKAGTINILNPAPGKPISKELLDLVDVLILNETELEILSNSKVEVSDDKSISEAVHKLKNEHNTIIVTLGEKGAICFTNDKVIEVAGRKVTSVDTTGAGDCFVGAIASKLSMNTSIPVAIEFANIAASICVTRKGAGPSMPTLDEVNALYK